MNNYFQLFRKLNKKYTLLQIKKKYENIIIFIQKSKKNGGKNKLEKKSIAVILLAVIIFGCFILYEENYLKNHAKLGTAYFEIPAGFHEVKTDNMINLTNGTHSIFIIEHKDNNTKNAIKEYKNMKGNNYSISIINHTVGNITVSKSNILNEPNSIHYWFINNQKLYEVYTWTGNAQTDFLVNQIISSMKSFIF